MKILLVVLATLPLAGCFSYSEAPAPTPVVVTPGPSTGTVVVQPAQ